MRRRRVPYALLLVVGLVALFGSAWAYVSGQQAPADQVPAADEQGSSAGDRYLRSDSGEGSVQLSATLLAPDLLEEDSLVEQARDVDQKTEIAVFVSLNTHSVPLTGYDLAVLSSLTSSSGERRPLRYLPQKEEVHHRSGILVFPRGDVDLHKEAELTLTVREVGGVASRALTWQLPIT